MNTLFRRTLGAFLIFSLFLVVILVVVLRGGYNRSLDAWSSERRTALQEAALAALQGDHDAVLRLDVPLFVYDRDRNLVATNRGAGRRRDTEGMPLVEIQDHDELLGFYAARLEPFQADTANRALMDSLSRAVVLALALAAVFATAAALFLARMLSRPAAQVAAAIDRLARGEAGVQVNAVGAREVREIAAAANVLARRLDREQEIRAQWVQDVAHDLRSPVASVKAQIEAICDGVYVADSDRMHRLLHELGRMEHMIGDLDELMRLEAPELTPEVTHFAAGPFLESLQERFAVAAGKRSLTVAVRAHVERISGDESLLYRAVSNLLSNAVRHASAGTTVSCTITAGTRITVHNEGETVPPQDLPRLFDRLYRGEYARNSAGSGLGLTIARRIVELHGGTIHLESRDGEGTTVIIDVPEQPVYN